jgi:hypothetical protein
MSTHRECQQLVRTMWVRFAIGGTFLYRALPSFVAPSFIVPYRALLHTDLIQFQEIRRLAGIGGG